MLNLLIFNIYQQYKFHAQLSWEWKNFITLGPESGCYADLFLYLFSFPFLQFSNTEDWFCPFICSHFLLFDPFVCSHFLPFNFLPFKIGFPRLKYWNFAQKLILNRMHPNKTTSDGVFLYFFISFYPFFCFRKGYCGTIVRSSDRSSIVMGVY